jgi:hypothetical protein
MKRQYLGDSKDSFKWDYHDFMTRTLGFHYFQVVWMMTPDDKGSHGQTVPERFPARLKFSASAIFSERAGTPET